MKTIKVGRSQNNDVVIQSATVSGNHAELIINSPEEVIIRDTNSTNGTFVNGKRIDTDVSLHPGDKVLLGSCPLNWQSILTPTNSSNTSTKKRNTVLIISSVASAIILCVAGWFGWSYYQDNRTLSSDEIYAKFAQTEVLVYTVDGYEASVGGTPLSELNSMFRNISVTYLDANKELQSGCRETSGTGFFISSDGKIMTNRHLVNIAPAELNDANIIREKLQQEIYSSLPLTTEVAEILNNLEVKHKVFFTGISLNNSHVSKREDFIPCNILNLSSDDKLDLGIIQTNNKTTPQEISNIVDFTRIASTNSLKSGSKIYTIGFPITDFLAGSDISVEADNQNGEITQLVDDYGYIHNIPLQQGASGSPVFDEKGRFAGVVVSKSLDDEETYNQIITPQKAAEFAKSIK